MPIQNESSNKNYHMKNIDEKLSNQFKCNKSQISTRKSKIATKCIRLIGITCVSIPNEYRTNNVSTCSKTVRPMVRSNIQCSRCLPEVLRHSRWSSSHIKGAPHMTMTEIKPLFDTYRDLNAVTCYQPFKTCTTF